MLTAALAISFFLSGSTLAQSDLSINSLIFSPPQASFGLLNSSSSLSCGFEETGFLRSTHANPTSHAEERILEDESEQGLGGTIFQDGFFKHSCHPDPREGSEEEAESESFCIFSNPTINRGAGMSVISKPSTLAESLDYLVDLSRDPEPSDTFRVVEMAHKGGIGVVAVRHLAPGDPVIHSRAILLASVEESTYDRPDWPLIRKAAIDLLPLETRNQVAKMYGTGQSEQDAISNTIDMNSFDISLGLNNDVPFFAMFLQPSQLNHDCRPNTAFYIDSQTLEVRMHALRPISPGEELTLSYRDMVQIRAERQHELAHYGFKCTCAHCSMSDAQAEESDRRIVRIGELNQILNDWDAPRDETMLSQADELVELYTKESLDNNLADGYTLASLAYNSFGHTARAGHYAAKAIEAGLISHGSKWEELEALAELAITPVVHWSHRARILE